MEFQRCLLPAALLLLAPAAGLHAQPNSTASIVQAGAGNEATVEQSHNTSARLSLSQSGGAHAGAAGVAEPGILQSDSGRLTTSVTQQGDVDVFIAQRNTDLGWVTVTQGGAGHVAIVIEDRNIDVTADIRQWNANNRSTQRQSDLRNGTADSWQSGSGNASMIDQSGSRVVIGAVLQEGSFGEASITQRNVASANASIRQPGSYNTASIEQADGAGLNAKIRQAGISQFAGIRQGGIDKNADIAQSGGMQRALAWQH